MKHVSKINLRPRYSETDQMGIIHHSRYFPWFELGRDAYFYSVGYRYKTVEDVGVLMPVISCHCQYIVPARYDDMIEIVTTLIYFNGVKMRLSYEVFREPDHILLAKAHVEYAFTNKESKVLNLKKSNKDIWALFNKVSTDIV